MPGLARAVLRAVLSREAYDRAAGDLAELKERVGRERGVWAARRACARETTFIVLWSVIERVRRVVEGRAYHQPSKRPMMVRDLGRDVRYGARGLWRSPGFTVAAVITLALGIGANTAIFSVVERVLLNPTPWPDPDRVVVIGWDWSRGGTTDALTPAKAQFWKESGRWFSDFAITDETQFVLTGEREPEQLAGELVSDGYFGVIGMTPAIGRGFVADEDRPGGPPVVILSHGLWRRRFGSDSEIVGREITLDGSAHTVIGVMPPAFDRHVARTGAGVDVLAPLRLVVDPRDQGHNYFSFGRLAPGVTIDRLEADLVAATDRFARANPGDVEEGQRFHITTYRDVLLGDAAKGVWMVFGAVGLVLLIACANVTSLLLGRVAARRQELAVRVALGAGRARMIRHLVAESMIVAVLGGAAGLILARWGLDVILEFAVALPGLDRVGLNIAVLGFTLLISMLTGIGIGLASAIHGLRPDIVSTLGEGGRALTAGAGRLRARGLLVMAEAAFSVVLLVGSGLLIVSLLRLSAVELGFEPDGVFTIEYALPPERYATTESTWQFERQLLDRIRSLPGVTAAGTASNLPLVRGLNTGVTVVSSDQRPHGVIEFRGVSPGFLDVIRVQLIAGRALTETDDAAALPVALVNEAFVRRFISDGNPLGAQISLEGSPRTVIGVVRDSRDIGVSQTARPTVFAPRSQLADGLTAAMNEWFTAAVAVRTDNTGAIASAMRDVIHDVDPQQPVLRMRPLTDVVAASLAVERFFARLLTTFAGLALVLTAVGVFGVVSYSVGLRRHEIGLRVALGARRASVIGLVVRQGMTMVLIGLLIGLVAAIGASRLLAGMLFGVSTTDPATFAAVLLVLGTVALLASYLPARRASRVDPMTALRSQ